ncbi:MAG: single-stranded DNA-binding protein [Spirochaetales bacterium]|nr:single-stranded DNA-binding protein [Spirochaetales bacterium]
MTDLNHVVLIGRLTQDLGTDERSFGYVGNGQARANVSIAVNRSKKNGDQWVEEVNFFNVTIWGKTAENLKPYLTKGKQICVEGHLKQDRWEKDGQKQSRISIVADSVQLLGGRNEGSSSGSAQTSFHPVNQGQPSGGFNDSFGDTGSDFPEDIPF